MRVLGDWRKAATERCDQMAGGADWSRAAT